MRARDVLRWLGWTITSWRRAKRQSTRDERPGTDEQFAAWPHDLNRFNDSEQADRQERGQI